MGIPVDRLCKKLNKQNGEICEMRYRKLLHRKHTKPTQSPGKAL